MFPEYRKHVTCEKLNVFSMLDNVTPGIIAPRIWMAHKTCICPFYPASGHICSIYGCFWYERCCAVNAVFTNLHAA